MSAQLLNTSNTVSEEDRKAVDQIAQSAVRMSTLIGELQDFSRTRLGGMLTFKRGRADIARLCENVVKEIRASTQDCRIAFSQAGNTVADVNDERIEQMLSNLIANAVQHGASSCDVDVAVTGGDWVVLISVRNMGLPIPPEALDRIFEPLYRADASTPAKRTHLGLGLYIARTIAIAHGGDIDVTSTEDAGTTFQVRLPREP